ncbi:MAG: PQQ-binding-like beta-propeller repeat protein [Bdellovibrionales bacterium]|jgi:outer membrane protein assembly factor BamB|nr:PQQ-binding-like beta-propeller repeat protein [Bdellovibrionales bacterium]
MMKLQRKTFTAQGFRPLFSALFLALLLSGCESAEKIFGSDKEPPLPGERVSVLQLQKDLVPNPALEAEDIALPEIWENKFWPQPGGYPNHAMTHVALSADMKRVWTADIGAGGDKRTPLTAVPVIADDRVFTLDTAGHLSAFQLENGKRLWRQSVVPRGEGPAGAVGGGLAWHEGKLYVTAGYKHLMAVDPSTGGDIWRAVLPAPARSAPTIMDGRVYLVTLDNRLMVYTAADGKLLWQYAGVSEATNLLGSASVAADETLVVLPLSSGELYGLRPENGQIVWQDNLSAVRRGGSLAAIADVRGLPVIDRGLVLAVSYSGRMVALDQVSGQRRWQREIGSAEMPWVAGDNIFVVTGDQQMVALKRSTGDVRWVADLPRWKDAKRSEPVVWAGPVLAGDRLIVTSSNREMLELSPLDGSVLAEHRLPAETTLAPVVAGGTMITLSQNGTLSAWR